MCSYAWMHTVTYTYIHLSRTGSRQKILPLQRTLTGHKNGSKRTWTCICSFCMASRYSRRRWVRSSTCFCSRSIFAESSSRVWWPVKMKMGWLIDCVPDRWEYDSIFPVSINLTHRKHRWWGTIMTVNLSGGTKYMKWFIYRERECNKQW